MNPSEVALTGGNAISPSPGALATLIPAGFTIEWWPIDRVKPYEKNARVISPKAVEKVAASIKEFGWRQPIVVDSEGVIVVGHVRLLAAQYLRLTQVPVHVASNLTPAQIKAYRLADNRTHEETTWNSELLGAELGELKTLDFNLALTGFEFGELASFLDGGKPGLTDEDATPALQELAVTRLGDLWVCGGQHRVMCGDSTSMDALQRLCSVKVDMVFTDPPYNVDYEGYTEDHLKIDGDRMSPEQFQKFLARAFAAFHAVAKAGASLLHLPPLPMATRISECA